MKLKTDLKVKTVAHHHHTTEGENGEECPCKIDLSKLLKDKLKHAVSKVENSQCNNHKGKKAYKSPRALPEEL
jgi:hypothetical protein